MNQVAFHPFRSRPICELSPVLLCLLRRSLQICLNAVLHFTSFQLYAVLVLREPGNVWNRQTFLQVQMVAMSNHMLQTSVRHQQLQQTTHVRARVARAQLVGCTTTVSDGFADAWSMGEAEPGESNLEGNAKVTKCYKGLQKPETPESLKFAKGFWPSPPSRYSWREGQ